MTTEEADKICGEYLRTLQYLNFERTEAAENGYVFTSNIEDIINADMSVEFGDNWREKLEEAKNIIYSL